MIYHLKLQPSEIEALDYYEYWYYVRDLGKILDKQNKDNAKQQEESNSAAASYKQPNIKMPKISTPNIKY